MGNNRPFDRPIVPARRSQPNEADLLATDLRVILTVLLGRSQLLRQRIRTGRVTDVHACMETLTRIDEAVRALDARLTRLVDEHAAVAADD